MRQISSDLNSGDRLALSAASFWLEWIKVAILSLMLNPWEPYWVRESQWLQRKRPHTEGQSPIRAQGNRSDFLSALGLEMNPSRESSGRLTENMASRKTVLVILCWGGGSALWLSTFGMFCIYFWLGFQRKIYVYIMLWHCFWMPPYYFSAPFVSVGSNLCLLVLNREG